MHVSTLPNELLQETTEEAAPRGRGRPRDEEARARILESALEVLEEFGYANATTCAIAERAGASKATIYRWWPNKSAVMLEALRDSVALEIPFPDTGDVRQDIRLQLHNFRKLLTGRRSSMFKSFVAAAQNDPDVAAAFRSVWVIPRRTAAIQALERFRGTSLRSDINLELLMDIMYGPLYYRLLFGVGELSAQYVDELADQILAYIGPVGQVRVMNR
jgi:AcrR family transcriptional regulator